MGKVFDVRAVSRNQHPLGKITYRLERVGNSEFSQGFFELAFNRSSSSWYLECVKKINLGDREEETIELTIRAIESAGTSLPGTKLFTDLRVNLKIINGDFCAPKFDKEIYEFNVLEGMLRKKN